MPINANRHCRPVRSLLDLAEREPGVRGRMQRVARTTVRVVRHDRGIGRRPALARRGEVHARRDAVERVVSTVRARGVRGRFLVMPDLVMPAPSRPAVDRRRRAAFLLVLVAASLLRVAAIGRRSPWFDEIASITNATGGAVEEPIVEPGSDASFTPADLWRRNTVPHVLRTVTWQDNGNGVVYGLLLHSWVRFFGVRDGVVRLPSAIAGVVVVVMVYRLGLLLFTPAVAWPAALLAVAHPLLIRYSQEA